MLEFAAGVATYVVVMTLATAAIGHARRPDDLHAALRMHGVLPPAAANAIGRAVTVTEVVLGVALIAGVAGRGGLLVAALAGSAALFAGYGGYGWFVVATGRSGPCGCGGADTPMSGWVAGRALALAALAVGALAGHLLGGPATVTPLGEFGPRLAVVLLAAGTFSALLWSLPAAMREPEAVR